MYIQFMRSRLSLVITTCCKKSSYAIYALMLTLNSLIRDVRFLRPQIQLEK